MCDYSLGGLPNRLAAEGDELIVHRFPTHSIGLAPAVDVQTKITISRHDQSLWQRMKGFFALPSFCPSIQAVCVPPGASLILKNIPFDLQCKWRVREEENVLFMQTSAEINTYRDAICFLSGRQVPLQHLHEGIRVKVVSLGGEPLGVQEPAAVELSLA
jgi:hypothetical protein